MKRFAIVLFTAVVLNVLPMTAQAEAKKGILNVMLGYGQNYFAAKRQLDNRGMGLFAVGYNLTNTLGMEAQLGVFNSRSTNTDNYGGTVHGTLFILDGVYHFKSYKQFEPYLMLGFGVLGLSYNNTDPNNEANVNGALGVQYYVGQQLGFRVEARDIYTINGGKNDGLLALGVNFLFDAG